MYFGTVDCVEGGLLNL